MASIVENAVGEPLVTILDSQGRFYFRIHATLREGHISENRIVQHPIEDGSHITDHVIRMPRILELEGEISDDPLSLHPTPINTSFGFFDSLSHVINRTIENSVIGSTANLISGMAARSRQFFGVGTSPLAADLIDNQGRNSIEAKQLLDALLESSEPVTIITGIDGYAGMVLEKLIIPRTFRTSDKLLFMATFKKITFAQSDIVDIPATLTIKENTKKISQGNKTTITPAASVENKAGIGFRIYKGTF